MIEDTRLTAWETEEEQEEDSVEMIASGYEWTCPKCEALMQEIEITPKVKCHDCSTVYNVDDYHHAHN